MKTRAGLSYGTPVRFTGDLLEAELGPGLLISIFDGLQNPLENVANAVGLFLPRGVYILAPWTAQRRWDYEPVAKVGDVVEQGRYPWNNSGRAFSSPYHGSFFPLWKL